ncbi:glycosyltransferase [Sutterella wadsworthensis]|uniref:glycosyltransferase n=1 Tax=Sutterella wadsworthensis TaxID=40545 RepID=UPI0013F5F0AE|nr:glycosyltransferase [Sutterella wadsworthensis]
MNSYRITLSKNDVAYIPLEFWNDLKSGLIFARITALTDLSIDRAAYVTSCKPISTVRLGLVITHFNRQKYVTAAINRIKNSILSDPNFGNIELFVIDNSSNLDLSLSTNKVFIIKNKNVGGSGGFTRGLLELERNGFTHCCFMDDDASCDVESIRRTLRFFEYANKSLRMGLGGTLLFDDEPNLTIETGGKYYRGRWSPVNHRFDVSSDHEVAIVDKFANLGNYGAWCYFAFAIKDVKHYAYPFFVRGDDVFFSLQNNFKITTVNGICTWVENFGIKESPITRYLGLRATLVISLLQGNMTVSRFLKEFYRWHHTALVSYSYASASAIEYAIVDILRGPSVFSEDIDGSKFRAKIKPLQLKEALNVEPTSIKFKRSKPLNGLAMKILRKVTFNGLMIPSTLFNGICFQNKDFGARAAEVFLSKRIYFYNRNTDLGYIGTYSKSAVIKHIARRIYLIFKVLVKYKKVAAQYRDSADRLTSKQFWESQFK